MWHHLKAPVQSFSIVGQYASLGVLIPESDSICVLLVDLARPRCIAAAGSQSVHYYVLTGRIVASGKN